MVAQTAAGRPAWYSKLLTYDQPDLRRAVWQLINTLLPYIALWYLMVRSIQLGYSYWITLAMAVVAAGLMVRIFIFFHDAVHGSFLASPLANKVVGYVTGILTFTPYEEWRRTHSAHHAMAGNLDRRGMGDVWTMTVEEYRAASPWQRTFYRLYRNPLVTFGLGPVYMFILMHRLPSKGARPRDIWSVHLTTLGCAAVAVGISLLAGLRTYLLIQAPVLLMGGAAGVWLFYFQHNFQGMYWARRGDWDYVDAALEGCSYYKLPKVLQWFTGSIGLHHIHHLRPRIPNYNLQRCYDGVAEVRKVKPWSLWESLHALRLNLYDERAGRMVGFGDVRRSR